MRRLNPLVGARAGRAGGDHPCAQGQVGQSVDDDKGARAAIASIRIEGNWR